MSVNAYHGARKTSLLLSLLLAFTHLISGLLILLFASWFIAASSIAAPGFNYMLPAVTIRALALLRISSGYFSMLAGHHYLLQRLALLRLFIFNALENKVETSRENALDAMQYKTEEVASIWMAFVAQNAGLLLALTLLNISCLFLIPETATTLFAFTLVFIFIYLGLLVYMLKKSLRIAQAKRRYQYALTKHIECASLWHLQNNALFREPSLQELRQGIAHQQSLIRAASLLTFTAAMLALMYLLVVTSSISAGNALFIVVPMSLLAVNDWLTPTLATQTELIKYLDAKHTIKKSLNDTYSVRKDAIRKAGSNTQGIESITLQGFQPDKLSSLRINAFFQTKTLHLFLGSSGSGKSRCLQSIAGLLNFDGQRIFKMKGQLEAQSSSVVNPQDKSHLCSILYIEQNPIVLSDTVRENLKIANSQASDKSLFEALEQVGLSYIANLDEWLGTRGRRLSGGERKRLGLARALLSNADFILIDEPFEALDEENIQIASTLILTLSENKGVIVATHIVPENLIQARRIDLEEASHHLSKNSEQYSSK
uniref:ATP-binding cassette domain-containing protein n=1 Tax=Ningiella ruwaisensis TaxID=2364274 RepID=UPI00109FFDC2|nr:ATP-binding cassette domain-containing protein [Ningiella ruwaisensis]